MQLHMRAIAFQAGRVPVSHFYLISCLYYQRLESVSSWALVHNLSKHNLAPLLGALNRGALNDW